MKWSIYTKCGGGGEYLSKFFDLVLSLERRHETSQGKFNQILGDELTEICISIQPRVD